jgi:hypothetical protein
MSFNTNELISKAINILKGAGAEYSIIALDGTVHSNAKRKSPKNPKYSHGERTAYVRDFLKNAEPGSVIEIPFGKYDSTALRNAVVGYVSSHFGHGTTMTSVDHQKKVVGVLRVV